MILYWITKQEVDNGEMKGTFALRSPHRPNPIGAAVLPIERIEEGRVFVKGLDCLNGTQLLDIKPAMLHENDNRKYSSHFLDKEEMYHWNQSNFEGLLELAEELATIPELEGLAEYCKLREQGLRKPAMKRLDDFIKLSTEWDAEQARRNLLIILEANARIAEAHQFITHPLLNQLIYPTLEEWADDEPTNAEPLRRLGLLQNDSDMLRQALTLDPDDVSVRYRLIGYALSAVDYATHHLGESILLDSLEEMRSAIELAREYIAAAPDSEPFAELTAEADLYEQMLNDWEAYNNAPDGTFPEWCKARGRTYSWVKAYYYE